jgi:glutamyl-tRNA synthetase
LHQTIEDVAKQFELKLGKVAQPVRVAVTGGTISPPIDVTLQVLGRKKSLERIERAILEIYNFE